MSGNGQKLNKILKSWTNGVLSFAITFTAPRKAMKNVALSLALFFKDLPQSWVCPACGVGKDEYEKVV